MLERCTRRNASSCQSSWRSSGRQLEAPANAAHSAYPIARADRVAAREAVRVWPQVLRTLVAILLMAIPCVAEETPAATGVTVTLELKDGEVTTATIAEPPAAPGQAEEAPPQGDAIPAVPVQPAIPLIRLAPAIRVQVIGAAAAEAAPAEATPAAPPWIPLGLKTWKYWDKPEAPGDRWLETDFDDQAWAVGAAPLGYGDPDIQGLVSFGEDANEKQMVTYFRASFELAEKPDIAWIAGGLICDDGAVVYLNGKEVERYNLPADDLGPDTAATATISAEQERAVWDFLANRRLLREGKNTIAVRVHQAAKTSSDIGFDLELRGATEEEVKLIRERIQKKEPRPQPAAAVEPVADPVAKPEAAPAEAEPAEPEGDAAQEEAANDEDAKAEAAGDESEDEAEEGEAKDEDAKEGAKPRKKARVARMFNRIVQAAVGVAADGEEAQPERSFMHIGDSEVSYYQGDGTMVTQRMDAVETVKMYVPEATMARAMEGDTLAKLARQHDLSVEHLSLLNNRPVNKPFVDEEVFCIGWNYKATKEDTIASVAKQFNSQPEIIAKLNQLAPDQALTEGQVLQVPGEFKYIHENKSNRYLQIAQYPFSEQFRVHRMPYNPQSVKMRREQVPEKQTLADYAKANETTAEQLVVMNGLDPKADLEKGQWILLEYSVEIAEEPNIKLLAETFGMEEAKLRAANGLDADDTVEAGRRMNIPIGDRMNQSLSAKQNAKPEEWPVFEVTLGEFKPAEPR